MENNKKTTSIRISEYIWQEFRILCLKKKIDSSQYIEDLLKKELKK
jgi:hypothetical protein